MQNNNNNNIGYDISAWQQLTIEDYLDCMNQNNEPQDMENHMIIFGAEYLSPEMQKALGLKKADKENH